MKVINTLLNIFAVLAAIVGVVCLVATYGETIVAWAKKLADKCAGKCPCRCGKEEAEPEEGKCCCQNAETPAEPAEPEKAEEPAEPEEPAQPAEPAEPEEVVAEDADFEG